MIDEKMIEQRIQELKAELSNLEAGHGILVQQIARNQTRHAEIHGALAELQKLQKPKEKP
jgi:phage shock protein A